MAPNAQACADGLLEAGLITPSNPGTYVGHDPSPELAMDVFVPTDSTVQGNAISQFAISHMDTYGIRYIIYNRRIYNLEIGAYWRTYSGENPHVDHVHFSFYNRPNFKIATDDGETMTDDEHKTLYEAKDIAELARRVGIEARDTAQRCESLLQAVLDKLR